MAPAAPTNFRREMLENIGGAPFLLYRNRSPLNCHPGKHQFRCDAAGTVNIVGKIKFAKNYGGLYPACRIHLVNARPHQNTDARAEFLCWTCTRTLQLGKNAAILAICKDMFQLRRVADVPTRERRIRT